MSETGVFRCLRFKVRRQSRNMLESWGIFGAAAQNRTQKLAFSATKSCSVVPAAHGGLLVMAFCSLWLSKTTGVRTNATVVLTFGISFARAT